MEISRRQTKAEVPKDGRAYLAAMWQVPTNTGSQCFLWVEQEATTVKELETPGTLSLGVALGQDTWPLENQFPSVTPRHRLLGNVDCV